MVPPTKKAKTNMSASAEKTTAATTSKQEEEKKFDGSGYGRDLVKATESFRRESPNVRCEDFASATEAKIVLESIIRPRNWPDILKGIYRPWSRLMMVGPPGNGTTMLAKAVATECKTSFFVVYSGCLKSEEHVRLLFEMARFYAPSTILIKELHFLCPRRGTDSEQEARRRVKSELLSQMEGITDDPSKRIIIISSTHYPWDIDSALMRRMGKIINIPLPNATGREALLKMIWRKWKLDLSPDVDLKEISRSMEGHDSEYIIRICRSASRRRFNLRYEGLTTDEMMALDWEGWEPPPVTAEDFRVAVKNTAKWTKKKDVEKFEKWRDEFFDLQ